MKTSDLLQNLNESQREAVVRTDGPVLILAGAGSGKTRVITHRIAYLIREKYVPPYKIFAVTFTNKACEEMKKRIVDLIGPEGSNVFIKTFHSASVFVLRKYGESIGIPKSFTIYDQSDQESVIKEILVDLKLDPKKIRPSSIASKISEIKDRADLVEGADASALMPDYYPFDFRRLYEDYNMKLAMNNALDFNDLLIKTVHLLRNDGLALSELQRRWKYFMIDEYQDTNLAQYLIARYLSSSSRNICVVGDDDQSIYSWRGADIKNILNFEHDYDDAHVVKLEDNYRSTQPILDAAFSVIRNNINRKEKRLRSVRGEGEPVVWCRANNEYGEAEYIVNKIISLKHRENYMNMSFALFYRTNAQSRVFEDALRRENIPYRVVGGLKFYDRKEIKDILAYLKFIANTRDTVSMHRIINTPSRGIGKATIEKIQSRSAEEGIHEWEVIRDGLLTGKMPAGINDFREVITESVSMAADVPGGMKLSSLVNGIVQRSGYRKSLEEDRSIESSGRLENIDELINSILDFEAYNPEAGLDEFIQEISLYTSAEDPDADPDTRENHVTLMTAHNAKGLEFPVVFLTGMEENTFPHRFSLDTDEGIEEERRLCYVGITRGMNRVFITSSDIRRSYAGVDYREPSRFLSEIPEDLLEVTSYSSGGFNHSPHASWKPGGGREWSRDYGNDNKDGKTPVDSPVQGNSGSKFKVLDRVLHPRFGQGQIIKIEGSGDNIKLSIVFASGKKSFLEKYTPLEKVG